MRRILCSNELQIVKKIADRDKAIADCDKAIEDQKVIEQFEFFLW